MKNNSSTLSSLLSPTLQVTETAHTTGKLLRAVIKYKGNRSGPIIVNAKEWRRFALPWHPTHSHFLLICPHSRFSQWPFSLAIVFLRRYTLHIGYPSIPQYLRLRSIAGLSAKPPTEAAAVPTGSWFRCYVNFDAPDESPKPVGMGRAIGDGGWYFHIADMALHPQHQSKGLGDAILKTLLNQIKQGALPGGKPYISLFAAEVGRRLYYTNGFQDAAAEELGVVVKS